MKNFLAVGVFAFVLALFLGCSNEGNDSPDLDNLGNLTGFQIYRDNGTEYDGNGIIRLEVCKGNSSRCTYEYLDIGTVANGKGTIDFFDIPDEYLINAPFGTTVQTSPPNTKGVEVFSFYLISGDLAYDLQRRNNTDTEHVFYLYVPQKTDIIGTETDYGFLFEFNINASKGWNLVYNKETFKKDIYSSNPGTVNLSKIKWTIDRESEASTHGGPG
ncbi:MAG: hypothetical protein LBH25_01845 [Fibromonadaceae bacterium]|jgi:hypothetical protein|nr:hypothetical protein [Fibromonadaceae bacterium]